MRRRRTLVLFAIFTATMTTAGLGPATGAGAQPPPAPPSAPAAQATGALSYTGRPVLGPDGRWRAPAIPPRAATAKDARRTAEALNQRSYTEPSTVAAASEPHTPPQFEPTDADARACLDSDGARNAFGRVYNRFLWCQRFEMHAVRGSVGPGQPGGIKLAEMTMTFSAVAYGRDDNHRDVRIFFRGDDLDIKPRKGYIRPESVLYQRIRCTGEDGCGTSDAYIGRQLKDWEGSWTSWTVSSDGGVSTARDAVLRHQWAFEGYVVDSWNVRLPGGESAKRTIRCDSAPYFGRKRASACVFDDVTPHLQYSVTDSKVKEVAEHIRCAHRSLLGCITYPLQDTAKLIPGEFREGERNDLLALHRVRSAKTDSPIADANRAVVRSECARLPVDVYDPSAGQQCDEYPFASTLEGAACCQPPKFDWDYSIRGVPAGVNNCAGNALKKYYREDRILYEQDGFFVRITENPPAGPEFCDALPPDEDEPDDGGPAPVNLPPTVDAGPDVTGAEGAPVALGGSASDPESGTPNVTWSAEPWLNVDPGASCSFGDTHRAATTITCTDDGVFRVRLTAGDGVNAPVSDTALVRLDNVAPALHPAPAKAKAPVPAVRTAEDELPPDVPGIVTPGRWQLFRVGTPVTLTAAYREPGANDTHTCRTDWDDGQVGEYPATPGDLTCRAVHTYDRAGMFTIRTSVTDDDTGSGSAEVLVVVYDPAAGVTRGNGWLDAPGSGGFDFTTSYPTRASTVPDGAVTYALPPRLDLNLRSHQRLEWLVVTPDGKIAVKGTAERVPGQRVGFVLYGHAGCAASPPPGCQPGGHRFRLVVWDDTAHGPIPEGVPVLYDNRGGVGLDVDVADPQPIHSGVVLIQRPPIG